MLFIRIAGIYLMAMIAVDVVLLPEKAITDLAIAANAELVKRFGGKIILNKNNCLPHISLAMGCINSRDVVHAGELLKPIAKAVPRKLNLSGIGKSTNLAGEAVSVLQVERTEQLQKLHKEICDIVRPVFSSDVLENMIAGGQASVSTLEWIRNYFVKSAYTNFSPHITVGYGELSERPLSCDFAVLRLAICHLGNHCTCAKILWSVEI